MATRPLVSVSELAATLAGDRNGNAAAPSAAAPILLDVRWELATGAQPDRHAEAHIPGAAFIDLDHVLSAPAGPGGRHPLPTAADFGAAMRAAGVSGERPVIVYDAGNALAAARAWWLLRHHGHPDARVLDGGLAAWRAAGHPVESGTSADRVAGDFEPLDPGVMPVLDADAAAAMGAAPGVLLDARAPERFRGDVEPLDRVGGHIPGARNVPMATVLTIDGTFQDPDTLRAVFDAAGAGADGEGVIGSYCGSGITAAHQVLALELAGLRGALYPGSWSEWSRDPARPVATGNA